ncbi:helix-turn-helix domain-containing protein [Halorubrum sp. DTA98]|uniref:helix-turn-helix domain-containing protein n=1 Tax=Halorubrum sp. DTA98 TaxID=3402163 RepID=UPI003AAE4488
MAIITEVRFAHEDGALASTLGALPEASVHIVDETSTTPSRNVYFFRIKNAAAEDVREALDDDRTVREVEPVRAVDDRSVWGIEFTADAKLLASQVTEHGGVVLDARSSRPEWIARGWRERWFFPDAVGIQDVWQYAREEGFEFEVLDHSRRLQSDITTVDPDPLTDQQRSALVAASERGYFTEPRETSLDELAEVLDISPSAVNGRIKRGLKALIGTGLAVEKPERERP